MNVATHTHLGGMSDIWVNLIHYYRNIAMINDKLSITGDVIDEIHRYTGIWRPGKGLIEFSDREKYVEFLLKWS